MWSVGRNLISDAFSSAHFRLGNFGSGLLFFLSLIVSGCGSNVVTNATSSNGSITGIAKGFIGLLSEKDSLSSEELYAFLISPTNAYAAGCTATASLYRLTANGDYDSTSPLTSVNVDSTASYKISTQSLNINMADLIKYTIEVSGCGKTHTRPLTNYQNQDVSAATTLLAFTTQADLGKKLPEVARKDVEALITDLEKAAGAASDTQNAYTAAAADTTVTNHFNTVFEAALTQLQSAAPQILTRTFPTSVNEQQAALFSISASHFNAGYTIRYLWKKDGSTVATNSNYTYTPSANDQGVHTIELFVGKDDGGGNIDFTEPYHTFSQSLKVNDSIIATPPALALSVPASNPVTTRNLTLAMNTGAAMANCASFSKLAISEDSATAPTNAGDYSITCTQTGSQDINYTLASAGDGAKKIYLWAMDSIGQIGPTPTILNVTLDTANPSATLTDIGGSTYRGGSSKTLSFSASDTGSGVASIKVQYASDGSTFADVTTLAAGTTSYSWTIPSDDVTTAKVRIVATDNAGNTASATSTAFTIDSTAPSNPSITLASTSPTNSTAVTLTLAAGTCAADTSHVFVNESATAPLATAAGWQTCSETAGAITYTLSGEASHTLHVWSKDAVGNVSTSSSTQTVVLDTTAPNAVSATLSSSTPTNSTNLTFTIASCTTSEVVDKVNVTESSTAPSASDAGWQACSTTASAIGYTLTNTTEGSHTLYIWAKDAAGNVSTSATASLVYDVTAPTLSSVSINSGDTYVGTAIVNVAVSASDNLSSLKIRVTEGNLATGDCQSEYADNSWQSYSGASQTYSLIISSGDGIKKACVWAKDAAGNVSAHSPSTGTLGTNMDTIERQVGNPPKITAFSVTNTGDSSTTFASGAGVTITWTVTDVEGLDNNPVTLDYTTDNSNWTTIISNYGSQSGYPTSYTGSYTSWTAPSAGYFRVRISAKDSAGNTSVPVISDVMNGGNWSIYAGTTDRGIGGGALAAALSTSSPPGQLFAVHPLTNDIYAFDYVQGLIKLDARTGIVSKVLSHGTTNLPTNGGTFTSANTVVANGSNIVFDKNGYLYLISNSGSAATSAVIYQLDLTNKTSRIYVGGGTVTDDTATVGSTSTMFVSSGPITFDEDNSLYFLTDTTKGATYASYTYGARLMKLTQSNSKDPGTLSIIAGDGTNGTPASGSTATAAPMSIHNSPNFVLASIAAWNHGNSIYYYFYGGTPRKIINGVNYSTTLTKTYGLAYNASTGKLYYNTDGPVYVVTPNLSGADGETNTIYITNTGTGTCINDGTAIASACVNSSAGIVFTPQGTMYFADGAITNVTGRNYRIRYVDGSSKIRTAFGSLSFYGDGLDRSLIRGIFSGIYYKSASESNQTAFPEGLYFLEANGPVFGYIDPSTQKASIIWGGQQSGFSNYTTGTAVSPTLSLGSAYTGGSAMPLTFDSNGLPWLRYNHMIVSIDANKKVVERTAYNAPTNYFMEDAATGATSATYAYAGPYSGRTNLTLKNQGFFYLGAYRYTPSRTAANAAIRMSYFDFSPGGLVTRLMGIIGDGAAADNASAGSPVSLSFSATCVGSGYSCYTRYRSDEDRIYFSEDSKIRYLTNSTDPSTATLGTLFTTGGAAIKNFIFNPANTQVFYIRTDGKLYCHDLSSGKAWCNDTSLGPTSGMTNFTNGPDQFTWQDSTHLLISTYSGYIYRYTLQP